MVRPAIATLIVAAMLGMAGRAAAELPMSPVYRTDQAPASGQPQPGPAERANSLTPARQETAAQPAHAVLPKPAKHNPSGKGAEAKAADPAPVVATAPIPPPPPLPAAVEPETTPTPPAPAKEAAARRHQRHYAARRPYAHWPYSVGYRQTWHWAGGWAPTSPPHLGPNPYSPNGGD